jgi:hypothetical protein
MKGKMELLINYYFLSIPTVEMLQKAIPHLCNFSVFKIVKLEPAKEVQSFFLESEAFIAHKSSLVISFTSLITIE